MELNYSTQKVAKAKNNTLVLLQDSNISFSSNVDSADADAFKTALINHTEDFLKKEGYTIKKVDINGVNIRDKSDAALALQVVGSYQINERDTKATKNANGYEIKTGKHTLGGNITLRITEPLSGEVLDSVNIDLAKLNISDEFSKATKVSSGDLLFGMFEGEAKDNYSASIAKILNLSYPKIAQAIDYKISKKEFDGYKKHIDMLKSKKSF